MKVHFQGFGFFSLTRRQEGGRRNKFRKVIWRIIVYFKVVAFKPENRTVSCKKASWSGEQGTPV